MYRRSFRRINFFLSPPVGAGAGTYVWNIVFLMQGVRVFGIQDYFKKSYFLGTYSLWSFWSLSLNIFETRVGVRATHWFWINIHIFGPIWIRIWTQFSLKKTYFLKPLYKKIMSPEEIFSQLNMVNVPVRYVFNLSCFVSNLSHIYLSGSGFVFVIRFRIRNTDPIWIRIHNTVRKHCWAPSNFAIGNNKTT